MGYPLVSIALCTYNGAKFLEEQLDSLIDQTYPNLEIVVVDDCSVDGTTAILQSYATEYPLLKFYKNEKNLGYIKNFERAITLCEGAFIALSDQDDIWEKDKIELLVSNIGSNKLIYHNSEFIDQSGNVFNRKMSDVVNMYEGDCFKPFLFFNSISGHACLFTKELANYSLPFPKEIFHDRWLGFTATNLGSIKYLDQTLVRYRQHENSDTNILRLERKKNTYHLESKQKIAAKIIEFRIFEKYKYNKNPAFLKKLSRLYAKRSDSFVCFGLVFFMYSNFKPLLAISKKSILSNINFVFRQLWGAKLK